MSMKNIISAMVILFSITVAAGNSEILPIFSQPSIFAPVVGLEKISNAKILRGPFRSYSTQHPLAHYNDFYEIETSQKVRGFASREVLLPPHPAVPRLLWQALPLPQIRIVALVAIAISGIFMLTKYLRNRRNYSETQLFIVGGVFLRLFLSLLTVTSFNNVIPCAADDYGYFEVIKDILSGSWSGPWKYTVGLGIWYLPFILLFNAGEFYHIAIAFDYFSMFVIAPAILVLGFFLQRKIGLSVRQAGTATLIHSVLPFVWFHLENWNKYHFPGFFALPSTPFSEYGYWRYYLTCIGSGFNAMSDTPGMLAVFAVILVMLIFPLRKSRALLAGAMFGFACLIRINYILFAPLLIFIALYRFRQSECRNLAGLCAWAAAGFLMIFGIQLAVNMYQFGSPLTFGYVLHYPGNAAGERPSDGFTWATLAKGIHIKYLVESNLALWTAGISAILLEKSRLRRTILALWASPLIIFFFGYSHTFCDAQRFIMPTVTAMLGAFAGLQFWQSASRSCRLTGGLVIAAILITGFPGFRDYATPFLLKASPSEIAVVNIVLIAAAACSAIFLWKKQAKQGSMLILLICGLYFFAPVNLYAILIALTLARAAVDGAILLKQKSNQV